MNLGSSDPAATTMGVSIRLGVDLITLRISNPEMSRFERSRKMRSGRLTWAYLPSRLTNRDRGKLRGSPPPTPPDMRVRIRRFGGLSNRVHSSSRNPKRVEVSVGQRDAERRRVRQPPRSEGATSRLSGQVFAHIPLA